MYWEVVAPDDPCLELSGWRVRVSCASSVSRGCITRRRFRESVALGGRSGPIEGAMKGAADGVVILSDRQLACTSSRVNSSSRCSVLTSWRCVPTKRRTSDGHRLPTPLCVLLTDLPDLTDPRGWQVVLAQCPRKMHACLPFPRWQSASKLSVESPTSPCYRVLLEIH